MKVSIHQPGYFPWLGFFEKIIKSDVFVFLDDAQFEKNYFDNRNRIKSKDGPIWITVPIKHNFGQKLNEVAIDNNCNWQEKHLKAIEMNYSKAPYFQQYLPFLRDFYLNNKWEKLIDLNLVTIKFILKELDIKTELVLSSSLNCSGQKGERILNILRKLQAASYLSGAFGRNYLDENKFQEEKIELIYQNFHHPIYPQIYNEFVPQLSAIDLLFNCGPKSREVLSQ